MNAFPNPHLTHQTGMTLRDYFAAQAVTWFLTKLDDEEIIDDHNMLRQFAAEHAYKLADAMMEARNVAQ
jgi:hypothetical protein